jgi:hypothetical protein
MAKASGLLQMVQALELSGCHVVIDPEVAFVKRREK